jgi:nucleoside-diphosphate-sugar epimerase
MMDNLERSSLLGHEVSEERRLFNWKKLDEAGVRIWPLDVSKQECWDVFDGHDYVLHFAGQCGVPTSIEKPRRDMEVNFLGTFNALEMSLRRKVPGGCLRTIPGTGSGFLRIICLPAAGLLTVPVSTLLI